MLIRALFLCILMSIAWLCFAQEKDKASGSKLPILVAHAEFDNQIGALPETVLFTPKRDGLFRVESYMVATTDDESGCNVFDAVLNYTDSTQPRVAIIGQGQVSGPAVLMGGDLTGSPGRAVFQAKAGTPITLTVTVISSCTPQPPFQYNLLLSLERLF